MFPFDLIKKKEKQEKIEFPIKDIIITKYAGAYLDYFNTMGQPVSVLPTRDKSVIIVWEKELKEKDKSEILKKLIEVL